MSETAQHRILSRAVTGHIVSIDDTRYAYFQHTCRYAILAGSRQLSSTSFAILYYNALTLERVLMCPSCKGELSLHTLTEIEEDPLFSYRYGEMQQEAISALLYIRASKATLDEVDDGYGVVGDYAWSYQHLFCLDLLDRQWWQNWYIETRRRWPESEIFRLQAWLETPWIEPLVIAQESDGRMAVWDGARSMGISSSYARLFIPALVGVKRGQVQWPSAHEAISKGQHLPLQCALCNYRSDSFPLFAPIHRWRFPLHCMPEGRAWCALMRSAGVLARRSRTLEMRARTGDKERQDV